MQSCTWPNNQGVVVNHNSLYSISLSTLLQSDFKSAFPQSNLDRTFPGKNQGLSSITASLTIITLGLSAP